MAQDQKYLIWSYEHRKWWKPNSMGYTLDIGQAGIYTYEKADEILKCANLIDVNEIAIDADKAAEWSPYLNAKKESE